MPTREGELRAARRQLERVLASPGFARNERQSRFLRFVVERHLEGKDGEIKESLLAIEVFGRPPDYDPKQDPIVRTEASRLRARLSEYYLGDGKDDPLVIELPKGGYVPAFRSGLAGHGPAPHGRRSPRRLLWATAAVACVVVLLAASWWRLRRQNMPVPIAVLPLINLNQDPANDYFADGLTGEIIRNLSIIDGLAVRSETSSFTFKGKPQKARDAGKQLGADYLVEGSVQRSGQQLRINAQLVRVRDDYPLWSGRYDREVIDIFAIQDEISRGIVNSLRLKLGQGRRRYETSAEAYDLYLRARAFGKGPGDRGFGSNPQIVAFQQAAAKDPSFAPAYSGLASALAYRSGQGFDAAERAEQMSQMREAAGKAVELDPLLAEAHEALGSMYARDAQWQMSEKSFRRALELDPNDSSLRRALANNLLMPLSRIGESVAEMRLAERSDPLSAEVQRVLAHILFIAGRFDEAIKHCPKPCLDALLITGRATEAIPILEERLRGDRGDLSAPGSARYVPPLGGEEAALGVAYAQAGRRDDAERMARMQKSPLWQAEILAALGDKDRAFEALERAIPFGPVRIGRDLTYPGFAPIRGDPRVKALRKKIGLPE
jgi:TolB-like protein/Flp pilus assembly protein TadD